MKKTTPLLILFLSLTISSTFYAQVGIGTSDPDPSAILEIKSDRAGLLIPRLALTGENDTSTILSPVEGLIIYNTQDNGTLSEGFVFYDGTQWTNLGWQLDGNIVGSDSFLGTINAEDLVFKAENREIGRLKPSGAVNFGLGSSTTAANSFALGNSAEGGAARSFAIGNAARARAADSYALGNNSLAEATNSMAIGFGAWADRANTIILGDANSRIGIGTSDPQAKLQINGSLRYIDTNQGEGKVLTSNGNGDATWRPPSVGIKAYGELVKNSDQTITQPGNRITVVEGTKSPVRTFLGTGNTFNITVAGVYRVNYNAFYQKVIGTDVDFSIFVTRNLATTPIAKTTRRTSGNANVVLYLSAGSHLIDLAVGDEIFLGVSSSFAGAPEDRFIVKPNTIMNIELIDPR